MPSGHLLLFQFNNTQDSLKLTLVAGPGNPEISRLLFEMAEQKADTTPLQTFYKKPQTKWNTIFLQSILSANQYHDANLEELEREIRKKWAHFLEKDLPVIKTTLQEQAWFRDKQLVEGADKNP